MWCICGEVVRVHIHNYGYSKFCLWGQWTTMESYICLQKQFSLHLFSLQVKALKQWTMTLNVILNNQVEYHDNS